MARTFLFELRQGVKNFLSIIAESALPFAQVAVRAIPSARAETLGSKSAWLKGRREEGW